jgi:TPR repeat protein
MKKLLVPFCLILTIFIGSAGMSWSADYQKGYAAYKSGDYATALREWKPLAEQGNAFAQNALGLMYRKGRGVPQDYKTAVKWYRLAAEQGQKSAQYNLGVRYEKGQGVTQDYKTAVKWYRFAAEQGQKSAQYNLGLMYFKGQGITQDNVYAHMWLNIAASSGHKKASRTRDFIAKQIPHKDIRAVQKRAEECIRKKYKGC